MSTASVIGALKVVLGGDTSGLDKSLKDSQSSLASFGKLATAGLAAVAGAATAASYALAAQVKSSIDAADKLNKVSQSSGLSTQELGRLKYAAELADVSSETLGKSMGKLSKALVSAGTDAAGQAGRAFSTMGIEVKNQDGTLRSSAEVIKDLADKFSGYRDGAEKTSLAIALFGKSGASMIPLLNAGRDGLEESAAEAEKFGLVLDKKTTAAAEAFNDNLKKMELITQGHVNTLTARLLPTFERVSEAFLQMKSDSTLFTSVIDSLGTALKGLVTIGMSLITTWQQIFATVSNVRAAMGLLASGDISGAMDKVRASVDGTVMAFQNLKQTTSTVWSDMGNWEAETIGVKSLNREVTGYAETWKRAAPSIGEAANNTKTALQKFLDTQAKSIAGHEAEAATIGKSVGEQARLKIEYEALAIAKNNGIVIDAAMRASITATGEAAAMAAMKVAGAQATLQAQNPTEQFNLQMTQLKALYDAGVISLETYGARQQQIAEAAQATWGQAGASIAGSFATISGAFSKESSAMATAAKVFGVIQGTISMFTGAAKALELPFPANIAAVAAVLAKGASLVASIKSQSVPTGFMTGGSFTVGGSGAADSQFVPIMASPGEQVDIWRPGEGGERRGGAGGSRTINVAVPMVTTRDTVRAMFEMINEGLGDGHRLNVVPV